MTRTRIIAVDDDRRILRVLKRACESVGYEVHSVLDAEFFASSFRVFEPELVFLDLNMRDVDGVELLRFIASERVDTSVIVTSGMDERVLTAAQSLGVSLGIRMLDPIRKPLMFADVRRRLKSFRDRPAKPAPGSIGESELREALRAGRIDVCYQPMVNLADGRVVGAEALARLTRADATTLMPDQFIGVAEEHGLIEPLTFTVLEQALWEAARWSVPGPEVQIALNISPLLLTDPSLPNRIDAELKRNGVSPERVILEITETCAPDDRHRMAETLNRLRLKGMRLALDDFGTGFCTLGQLYEFPYEVLKLDKKFAMRATQSEDAAAMIRSSLDLARSVGLTVVVEGIQSEDTLRWLVSLGCDVGQGFHIAPPLPAAAFAEWLARPRIPPGAVGTPPGAGLVSASA